MGFRVEVVQDFLHQPYDLSSADAHSYQGLLDFCHFAGVGPTACRIRSREHRPNK